MDSRRVGKIEKIGHMYVHYNDDDGHNTPGSEIARIGDLQVEYIDYAGRKLYRIYDHFGAFSEMVGDNYNNAWGVTFNYSDGHFEGYSKVTKIGYQPVEYFGDWNAKQLESCPEETGRIIRIGLAPVTYRESGYEYWKKKLQEWKKMAFSLLTTAKQI